MEIPYTGINIGGTFKLILFLIFFVIVSQLSGSWSKGIFISIFAFILSII